MRESEGGGGRILIDPSTLKAGAGRVRSAEQELTLLQSQLGSVSVPALPPGVAGVVEDALAATSSSLAGDPQLLGSLSIELTRRAFWAEYADRIMAGYPLDGAARKEFVAWMKDGSLVQYADPFEAGLAGRELATLYRGFRDDPRLLIDLAQCLRGAEQYGTDDVRKAFGAGFVDEFGAKNMELVPRVIQAMQWSRALTGDLGSLDPHLLRDVAMKWEMDGNELSGSSAQDLLAPFALALANATTSGQLTRTVEDEIAHDPDTWATAALVSSGTFSKDFLLQVFRTGVVDKIANESVYHSAGFMGGEAPSDAPYRIGDLPYDSKQIVLDALARNPEAAAAALTQHLSGVEPMDLYGRRNAVTSPLELIYTYGHFDDDGSSFGHAFASATDHLNDTGDRDGGAVLTQQGLKLMLGDGDGMDGFKDGLAHDLAVHHMQDLFSSAVALDRSGPGVVDLNNGHEVMLSQDALTETLKRLGDQPSALRTVLHSGAVYQGALINEGTSHGPGASADWAYKAAAFDAHVLNAADLSRLDHFDVENERHQLVAGFFKSVVNDTIAIENPIAATVVHTGVDSAIDGLFPGPDLDKVVTQNTDAKAFMVNSLHAAIAGGYYEHGYLHGHGAPPPSIAPQGNLVAFDPSSGSRWDYETWMNGNGDVEKVSREALNAAARAFGERDVDLVH